MFRNVIEGYATFVKSDVINIIWCNKYQSRFIALVMAVISARNLLHTSGSLKHYCLYFSEVNSCSNPEFLSQDLSVSEGSSMMCEFLNCRGKEKQSLCFSFLVLSFFNLKKIVTADIRWNCLTKPDLYYYDSPDNPASTTISNTAPFIVYNRLHRIITHDLRV